MDEENDPIASMIGTAFNGEENRTESSGEAAPGPLPFQNDLLQCQLSTWYPTFSKLSSDQKRSNVTIATTILADLPPDFRDYLLSDGVRLPLEATSLSSCAPKEEDDHGWSSDEDDNNDNNSDCSQPPQQFYFPELNKLIHNAIESHGGSIIPKLNWSSPKDAAWVNCGSIKCKTPGDVYLLLKSSDFCLHDVLLHSLKDDCQDYDGTTHPPLYLALRKWCNLHPNMEFRCFVRQHELLAISQRHHTQHYPHLMQDYPRIRNQLLDFFEDTIRHRFANGTVSNYVVDVYLDKKDRVSYIMLINDLAICNV
jgi:hypothetical protein